MTPKQVQAMQELSDLGQEMNRDEPEFKCEHDFQEFPGSRWGFARCINCGDPAPEPHPDDFD